MGGWTCDFCEALAAAVCDTLVLSILGSRPHLGVFTELLKFLSCLGVQVVLYEPDEYCLGLTTDRRDGLCSRLCAVQSWGHRGSTVGTGTWGDGVIAFGHCGHAGVVCNQIERLWHLRSLHKAAQMSTARYDPGEWHRLMSSTLVASSEVCLPAQQRAPAMRLAGLFLTDTPVRLHFIFMILWGYWSAKEWDQS